jgi:selenide,water dikinase
MPQGRLAQVLRGLGDEQDERLLVGPDTMDDAGVVQVEGVALVQTVDFFPPVVDDPRLYGAIAAANALSDVYAMGGRPVSALTLASFPTSFPEDWMGEILLGGFGKVHEAGAVVAGGHTVEGEVQFGFACTGVIDPDAVTTNAGAQVGDVAYLTKALGMGAMTTGAKAKEITWDELLPAAEQMAALNSAAAEAMAAVGAHACTDITGFGLMGHTRNIAVASGVTIRVRAADAPVFPGALDLAERGVLSGGSKRGQKALKDEVTVAPGVDEALRNLLFDAETSGGLFIVVAADEADALERELRERALPVHRLAEVVASTGAAVELV